MWVKKSKNFSCWTSALCFSWKFTLAAPFQYLPAALVQPGSTGWRLSFSLISGFPQRQDVWGNTGVSPQVATPPPGGRCHCISRSSALVDCLKSHPSPPPQAPPAPTPHRSQRLTLPFRSSGGQRGVNGSSCKRLLAFPPGSLDPGEFSTEFIPITLWSSLQGSLTKGLSACPDQREYQICSSISSSMNLAESEAILSRSICWSAMCRSLLV